MNNISNRTKDTIATSNGELTFFSLSKLQQLGRRVDHLPFSIRILLENALRNYDGFAITDENLETIINWSPKPTDKEIPFKPARVLMQDFTGVPAVVDIASLRAEMARKGKDPQKINPLIPVDLVIDHSVQIDYFGTDYSFLKNVETEYQRNSERYQFLKWAQKAFNNFSVVPPGMGICHQINLEYLAKGVIARDGLVFPDTLVGTDSHTPMINGIGVVGWGVGGIEAEAALLGQPIYFIMPEVVGLKLTGKLPIGTTATDMVLTITQLLRKQGVVGKFVEVFGDGLNHLTVTDRATISNMSPEFGCTVTYFPIDNQTLEYMRQSNRPENQVKLVEEYCKANLLWRTGSEDIIYSHLVELDLGTIEPSMAGPKRPHDKILLRDAKSVFKTILESDYKRQYIEPEDRSVDCWLGEGGSSSQTKEQITPPDIELVSKGGANGMRTVEVHSKNEMFRLSDGAIVIAAITSCTNTSNPSVMIGAGLMARKARLLGLDVKPWVKTSLEPGSKVVTDYLEKAGLLKDLEALRFHVVGYGCGTCIGNSGPLPPHISVAVDKNELVVASALSGNRNFEARVHSQVRMNYLMSPILVVAYAIAGRIDVDLINEPLAYDPNHNPVFLKDIWPQGDEIKAVMDTVLSKEDFGKNYDKIFEGNEIWKNLVVPTEQIYKWDAGSTYIKEAPFFRDISGHPSQPSDINGARALLVLGDFVTTDHISPAGSFGPNTPAGQYLLSKRIEQKQFNSYGSRRGNDEVMIRGTFANVRIKNKLAAREGGFTAYQPSGEQMTVYDAAQRYKSENTPLIVLAGKEYGSGSSRDWAAKGTYLLGIRAVIAESYERIHRSNLIGMGVLPLQFLPGSNAEKLGLTGKEVFAIKGIDNGLQPMKELHVVAVDENGKKTSFDVIARIDSLIEVKYYEHGGIMQYVLRDFLSK